MTTPDMQRPAGGAPRLPLKTREAVMAFRAIGRINRTVPNALRRLTAEELDGIRAALEEEYRIATSLPDPPAPSPGRPRREG